MAFRFSHLPQRTTDFFLVIALCLPLFLLNVKNSHDWGGDFAMYLQQAHLLNSGQSQDQTGYVFNPEYPMLGPPAYPMGFPLLVSPVERFAGKEIRPYLIYLTAWLLALGGLLFALYRATFSRWAAVLLALIFVYNPSILSFKGEIMPEIPFMVCLIGAALTVGRGKSAWLAGLLGGAAICIKGLGWAFPVAVIAFLAISYFYHRKSESSGSFVPQIRNGAIVVGIAVAIPILVNRVIFSLPGSLSLYQHHFQSDGLPIVFLQNLAYYLDVIQWFFQTPGTYLNFLSFAGKAIFLALMLLGLTNRLAGRLQFMDVLVLIYAAVLLIYPYRSGGIRFILPILPFLIMYAAEAAKTIPLKFQPSRKTTMWAAALLILLSYTEGILKQAQNRDLIPRGPQRPAAIEAFREVEARIPQEKTVVFAKPRVLAYYTSRASFALKKKVPVDSAGVILDQHQFDWVLTSPQVRHAPLDVYLKRHPEKWAKIWQNEQFKLFHRKKVSVQLEGSKEGDFQ